ncbi:ABC transporter substrate binding protein [Pseudomonadota bacterium]
MSIGSSWAAWADSPQVAVIYPETREPYKSVFRDVVSGITEGLGNPPTEILLASKKEDVESLAAKLKAQGIDVVITLGRKGLMVGHGLSASHQIIAGAVLIPPALKSDSLSGITLTPDPAILLQNLKRMAPKVTRVTVIFNPKRSGWLIKHATEEAASLGIELNALAADNIRTAATLYRDYLSGAQEYTDAIWLLQDATILDERAVLPKILSEAWSKNLVVVSNNPGHVRKGALFSLYPDNMGMGRSLAAMAKVQAGKKDAAIDVQPLQDLLIAVNLRTAGHLGIHFSNQDKRGFSMLFPSP